MWFSDEKLKDPHRVKHKAPAIYLQLLWASIKIITIFHHSQTDQTWQRCKFLWKMWLSDNKLKDHSIVKHKTPAILVQPLWTSIQNVTVFHHSQNNQTWQCCKFLSEMWFYKKKLKDHPIVKHKGPVVYLQPLWAMSIYQKITIFHHSQNF